MLAGVQRTPCWAPSCAFSSVEWGWASTEITPASKWLQSETTCPAVVASHDCARVPCSSEYATLRKGARSIVLLTFHFFKFWREIVRNKTETSVLYWKQFPWESVIKVFCIHKLMTIALACVIESVISPKCHFNEITEGQSS
jgi:hypothetical protein